MVNTQLKRSSSGKQTPFVFFLVLCFAISCTSIQQAVIQDRQVIIHVENVNEKDSIPNHFYQAEIKRNGGERELHVDDKEVTTVYMLPSNKLTLLYEMEMGLQDIQTKDPIHHKITIQTHKSKKVYKVNTDLIYNFIKGLKKK